MRPRLVWKGAGFSGAIRLVWEGHFFIRAARLAGESRLSAMSNHRRNTVDFYWPLKNPASYQGIRFSGAVAAAES